MSRVAIVTGASRGIGAATARALARDGHDVCVAYRNDEAAATQVVRAAREAGRLAIAIRADMASEQDIVGLFAAVDAQLGRPCALVNNAGIVDRAARVDEMTSERIERMLQVNVLGPFLCAREAVRRMSTRHGGDGGVIVNVSSLAADLGGAGVYVDYAASKAAIDTFTIGLAREVAGEGIRVAGVRPGIIDTEIHADAGQPDRAAQSGSSIPLGRAGRPEEVAATIAWLCSDAASYVTGALLDVTGGR